MCGRYEFSKTPQELASLFLGYGLPVPPDHCILPHGTVHPGMTLAVLTAQKSKYQPERMWLLSTWGMMLPADNPHRTPKRVINARMETASEKPLFRRPWHRGRCVIIMSYWWEWNQVSGQAQPKPHEPHGFDGARPAAPKKEPWSLGLKGQPLLASAGLLRSLPDGDNQHVILTREAAPEIVRIHHRMPVLIDAGGKEGRDAINAWLWDGHISSPTSRYTATRRPHPPPARKPDDISQAGSTQDESNGDSVKPTPYIPDLFSGD